jgi:ribosome-associated heat shock protein Hsp15
MTAGFGRSTRRRESIVDRLATVAGLAAVRALPIPTLPIRSRLRDHARMKHEHRPAPTPEAPAVRLDIWLWAARFFKTRSLAKQAIEGGKVELETGVARPARGVHVGDRLRIARGEERYEIDVLALSEARGPASVAQHLYRETEAGRAAREAASEQRRLTGAGYAKPATKPDKRARRLIRALGDIEMM